MPDKEGFVTKKDVLRYRVKEANKRAKKAATKLAQHLKKERKK